MDTAGQVLVEESSAEPEAAGIWESTWWAAVSDAAEGRRWVHEPISSDPDGERYRTQRRRVLFAGRWLGLSAEVTPRQAEQIAGHLGVPGVEHQEARREYRSSALLKRRGAAVCAVLGQLEVDSALWLRLLAAGEVAGCWGPTWVWLEEVGRCERPGSQVACQLRGRAPTSFVLPPATGPP